MQRDRRDVHDDADILTLPASEPLASISDPPGEEEDGNSRGEAPPNRQHKIGCQPEDAENHPEDFPLHGLIVS